MLLEAPIMPLMSTHKPKRPIGRPQVEVHYEVLSGRVHPAVKAALNALAKHNKRKISSEVDVAAEDRVLQNEALLRFLGIWSDDLDTIKKNRRVPPAS
jgi:hypothetical protein